MNVIVPYGYENLVIICWLYIKNCIFVHMTFSVTGPLLETAGPPKSGGAKNAPGTKYEVSTFTHYEGVKGDEKCKS